MTQAFYEFRGERVEALLRDAASRVVTEDDLDETWEHIVEDGSESALLVTELGVPDVANRFVSALSGLTSDPRHRAGHREALNHLANHEDCAQVLGQLTAQRDDVLASIIYARNYCINDAYGGEYGDPYVNVENFLDYLRPALPARGRYSRLDVLEERCRLCHQLTWDHEDWCDAEERLETLTVRRDHAISSHLHCEDIGHALIDHISRCIARTEDIAHQARVRTIEAAEVAVFRPHEVLPKIVVADLDIALDPRSPPTLFTNVEPPLEGRW